MSWFVLLVKTRCRKLLAFTLPDFATLVSLITIIFVHAGGMQDWNYFYTNDLELTIEQGCIKYPMGSQLKSYWDDNKYSYLTFIAQVCVTYYVCIQGKNDYCDYYFFYDYVAPFFLALDKLTKSRKRLC